MSLLGLFAGGCSRAGGEAFQPTLTEAITLGDHSVVQTFTPATAELTGVDLLVATFGRPVDPTGELTLRLHAPHTSRTLGQGVREGVELSDGDWVHIDLGAVDAPELAAFEVSWDGDTPLALWANVPRGDRRTELPNDPYPGGELLVDGRPPPGDLAFRVHGVGAEALPGQALEIVASTGNRLLDVPWFSLLWLLLLAASLGLAWAFRR